MSPDDPRETLEEAMLQAIELERRRCTSDFSFFARQAWHTIEPATKYVHGYHIEAIVDHLTACLPRVRFANTIDPLTGSSYKTRIVEPGHIRKLLVNMPPRHMKSSLVSVLWPAWVWTFRPEMRWLFTSYALALSIRDTMKMRAVLSSPWYQTRFSSSFRLLADQNEKSKFFNTSMGYRISGSVDAGVTGEGGDVVCFPGETLVRTEVGPLPIGLIVRERLAIRVWSRDLSTGESRLSSISGWHSNPGSPLVRISTPGGSFRCTPDHRILTRGGWVEAARLGPLDVLPRCSVSDPLNDCLVDSECLCEAPAGLSGLQNLLYILLGDLGHRVLGPDFLVRLFVSFGVMYPRSLVSDCGDVSRPYPKFLRELFRSLRSLQDSLHILFSEFGVRGLGPCFEPLCPDGIFGVLASGSVGEVFDSVVQRVSVQVSRVLSCLPLPDECFCDELVDESLKRLSVLAQVDAPVSVAGIQFKRPSWYPKRLPVSRDDSRDASSISVTGDHVEAFESGDISPLFVSNFGHCDTSYCLTVESDHNFILCVGGDSIVVSNCVDDPHNVRDADSEATREATKQWWFEAMSTRLNDAATGSFIVVMQRVHEKDLAAECRDRGYVHLNLPARFDVKRKCVTSLGWEDWRQADGELLWPDRFSDETLRSIEETLGEYGVNAQLQQDPKPRGGAFIKRDWFKRIPASALEAVGSIAWGRAWDLALSKTGDRVASVEIGMGPGGETYLRRGLYWREDWAVSLAQIAQVARSERGRYLFESIGTTKSAGQEAAKVSRGHCVVDLLESKENKVSMAMPWIARAQAGKIFLVEETEEEWALFHYNSGSWIEHFLNQFAKWIPDPSLDQEDDEVDSVSLAFFKFGGLLPLDEVLADMAPESGLTSPRALPFTDGYEEDFEGDEEDDFGGGGMTTTYRGGMM